MYSYVDMDKTVKFLSKRSSQKHIHERVKNEVFVYCISPDTELNRHYKKVDKKEYRKTILVPPESFDFSNEIFIFENKVLIISFEPDLLGICIESEQIAKGQVSIYKLILSQFEVKKKAFRTRKLW